MNGIANQEDVCAIERNKLDLPESTYAMIGKTASRYPTSAALSFFFRAQDHERPLTWDYRTLFGKITATANFFNDLGVGKDDVVAFVLPNLPATHLTIWGGQAAGVVFAINPMLEPAMIAELLRAGGAKVLVTLAPFPGVNLWQKLQPVLSEVEGLQHVALVNLACYLPSAEAVSITDKPQFTLPEVAGIHVHSFEEGIQKQPTDRLLSGRHIKSDDLSSYFCTGGTTGAPKIAKRTHRNEVSNAWSASQVFGDGISIGKTLFCGLPMFHVNAVLVTGLLPFSRGAHVLLGTPQGFRGEGVISRFWEMVETHRINFFSGVPTLYAALMQFPTEGHQLDSLEFGLCGAAPMPMELMRSFQERTGLKILEGYGLTEGTCVSTVNPPYGERRIGSIGLRIPLQSMKAVLLDDSGAYQRDCVAGEVGVLLIRGPNVFLGYRLEAQNKGLWIDAGGGADWLNTGDLGRQDAEGYFYLTGRKKELIIRGGHNIDPAMIEEPLHQHPAILLAAAIGRPDAHSGEIPVVYVQLKPGSQVSETELMAFACDNIGERAALPKAIKIVSEIPLTAVGKIFKPKLKQLETQEALSDALRSKGVNLFTLTVVQDASLGTWIDIKLDKLEDQIPAKKALGLFPFQARIQI